MAKPIGTLGNIDTITVGGRIFTDLSTIIIVTAPLDQSTGAKATFRLPGGTAGYPVTAAKTYTVHAISLNANTAISGYQFLYSDNDVGLNTATAHTNPIYENGGSITVASVGTPANTFQGIATKFAIPAGKYPGSIVVGAGSAGGHAQAWGYET